MALIDGIMSQMLSKPASFEFSPVNFTALLGRPLTPLRIGVSITRSYEPYIMFCARNMSYLANSPACPRPGYAVEIMHSLMTRLKIDYVVVPLVESAFGTQLANGTWTGMLGRLHSGDIDTIVGEATPSEERMKDFAFSTPYALTSDRIAVSGMPPPLTVFNLIGQLFSMFDVGLWMAVLMVGIISALLIIIYKRTIPTPTSLSTNLLTVIAGVSAAIFMNLYVAVLLSSLISTGHRAAISNMDAMFAALENKQIKMTTEDVDNALYNKLLVESETTLNQDQRRFRQAILKSGGVHLTDADDDKYSYSERGVGAVISTSRLMATYSAARKCDVTTFPSNIMGMLFETFPFRADFNPQLLDAFNTAIISSFDTFTLIMERYSRPVVGPMCHSTTEEHSNTMNMLNFVGLFIVFTIGCATASGALLVERRKKAKKVRKESMRIADRDDGEIVSVSSTSDVHAVI